MSSGNDESQPQFADGDYAAEADFDIAALSQGGARKVARGKLADLPDFAAGYQSKQDRRFAVNEQNSSWCSRNRWAEMPERRQRWKSEMIVKAVKRDADRAEMFAAEKNVASLAIDIPELVRSLSGDDIDDQANPRGLPEAMQPLIEGARLSLLSVSLTEVAGASAAKSPLPNAGDAAADGSRPLEVFAMKTGSAVCSKRNDFMKKQERQH